MVGSSLTCAGAELLPAPQVSSLIITFPPCPPMPERQRRPESGQGRQPSEHPCAPHHPCHPAETRRRHLSGTYNGAVAWRGAARQFILAATDPASPRLPERRGRS